MIEAWGKGKKPKAQTVESILKAAEDAKHTAEALNKRGKELGDIAKEKRKIYEEKQGAANEAAREVSEYNAKARELKARLTRSIRRLETLRHEAVHDAHRTAQAEVDAEKRAHSELKQSAQAAALEAAAKEGATASLAINASKHAARINGLADVEEGDEEDWAE